MNNLRRSSQRVLHINSCFRDQYYKSSSCNYHYDLPESIKQAVSMRLVSLEVPNAWYQFSHAQGNNRFIVEVTSEKKAFVYHVVVPDGNYTKDELVNYLNSKYFYQSTDLSGTNLKYLKVSVDNYNHKTRFEITNDAPISFVFSLHFMGDESENIMNTLGWALGFRLARYVKIDGELQSEGLFDDQADRYVYLCVNDYTNCANDTSMICFDKTTINESVLAKVQVNVNKETLITNENSDDINKTRFYNGPVTIKRLNIKLLDRYGDVVDLNNMDYSISLEFDCLYDRVI